MRKYLTDREEKESNRKCGAEKDNKMKNTLGGAQQQIWAGRGEKR